MSVGVRGHLGREETRSIDTSGILLLAGGAFSGIERSEIRSKRSAELQRELSRSNPNAVVSADIVSYGFMPELVARLPILVEFSPLGEADLLAILKNPEISPVQVWVEHFGSLGKELVVTAEAKALVAKRALTLKMGARGLQQVLFPFLARMAYSIEAQAEKKYEVRPEHLEK